LAKTSLGLEENLEGALCYVLGLVTGIVFLVLEKESKFVRFHAVQSIIVFGGLWILSFVLGVAFSFSWALISLGFALTQLINLVALAIWIVCMYKAYKGEVFKLPVVGDIAERHAMGG
jgi:uncharacterized membrane protein